MIEESQFVTRITREVQIDVGHRLPFHNSLCRNVHGHRYRIVAEVEGPVVRAAGRSDSAMVVDFSSLKDILLKEVHEPLDHGFMVWEKDEPLRGFLQAEGYKVIAMADPPTAEALAAWCFDRVEGSLAKGGGELVLRRIVVWETPNCSATCERPML